MQYKLTDKGIQEARKKRTIAKGLGEAVSWGGPWKGEEYSNMLLITLLSQPRKPRTASEIRVETWDRPRPSEATVSRTLNFLASKGYVKADQPAQEEPKRLGHHGFADKSGRRLTRKPRPGFRRVHLR